LQLVAFSLAALAMSWQVWAAAAVFAWPALAKQPEFPGVTCPPWWYAPEKPQHALQYNGLVDLKPACFNISADERPHQVYVIGDWGGVLYGTWVAPADHRSLQFKAHHRQFVKGVDDLAQRKVAQSMMDHAALDNLDYVLNVGDNFYWGGIDATCGRFDQFDGGKQWQHIYEDMYGGALEGKQWLSVLGNHDWGGWYYLSAWDQTIAYTWGAPGSKDRWFQPSLYYKTRAIYQADVHKGSAEEGFVVDYFFVDTNMFDAFDPETDEMHNICGVSHNAEHKGCAGTGPGNPGECKMWFIRIWKEQCSWLAGYLEASVLTSDWQIVVTHFPPLWGMDFWQGITKKYGVDMMITGHTHHQQYWRQWNNPLDGTAVIISGGGGGITSEEVPNEHGWDDEYGFFKLEMHRNEIIVRMVSHGGQLRKEDRVYQIPPSYHVPDMKVSPVFMPVNVEDENTKPEVNEHHEKIKAATKGEKVDDLLAQLEAQRLEMMKGQRQLREEPRRGSENWL